MKRMITIGFLIIIAPLITITYSIDKMGDQKAQALNNWLKEFIYNVLIQPFHCILYLAFGKIVLEMLAAGGSSDVNIATAVLAILCIQFIKDGEKIVKKIFGFDAASSMGALSESAKAATAAMGVGTKAGIAAGAAVGKGAKALGKMPGKIGEAANKAADKVSKAASGIANSKVGKAIGKGVGKVTKPVGKAIGKVTKPVGEFTKRKMKDIKDNVEEQRRKRREDKIDAQMRKMMTPEQYEKLRNGQDTPEGKKAFEAERNLAVKALDMQKEERKENRRKINGAVGKAASWTGQKLKMAGTSPATKAVIGAIGAISLGSIGLGDSLTTGINTGQFGYGFTKGLMSTSTRTAERELENQIGLQNNLGVDVDAKHLAMVKNKGDGNSYDNKEIAKKLQKLLDKLNELGTKNAQGVVEQLNYDLSFNPQGVSTQSIEKILSDAGVSDENKGAAMDAMMGFAQFRADAGLYQAMENGHAVGMNMNDMFRTVDRSNNVTRERETHTHEEHYEEIDTDEVRETAAQEGRAAAEEVVNNGPIVTDTIEYNGHKISTDPGESIFFDG